MAPLLFRTPQQDTSTCHVPFCLGTDTAPTQRMVHASLFAVMHALEESVVASFVPQLLAAFLLLRAAACSSHDHLLEPHCTRRHRCGLLVVCAVTIRKNMLLCCWGELICSHAYAREKWCLYCSGHLNLSCAFLSLQSYVFIFWNRYCTYTGSAMRFICNHLTEQDRLPKPLAVVHIQEKLLLGLLFRRARPACVLSLRFIRDHFTEQRCRFRNPSSCLLCISTRNRCFVCCSGQLDLSRTVLSLKVHQ